MIKKIISLISLLLAIVICTGCWDQRPIKDRMLINGLGFDINQDHKIELNASILNIIGKGTGAFDLENELITTEANSVVDAGIKVQTVLPGGIETAKTRLFLLGEDFSKEKFQFILDQFNRTPFTNVNVNVVVTNKQKAKDILELETLNRPISFVINETVDRAKRISIIPNIDLQKIYTMVTEIGIDILLPVVDKTKDEHVGVLGAGLFHKGSYTGKFIEKSEAPILLMMMDQFNNTSLFVTRIQNKSSAEAPYNIISYELRRPSREFIVHASKNKIDVDIPIKAKIRIGESTNIQHISEKEIKSIIEKDLNKRAKIVIKEAQQANSDVLGVGRYIKEHNPKLWKSLDWDKKYPTIQVHPRFNIYISNTGILET
ncbi:Ger(x)C family spore germination protein [Arthrobacter citreus]|nr:Ger(x)C family spore germination protein [Arthrobacter citreus]